MPPNGCKFDVSTFQRGLKAKLTVTKRTAAEVINQAGGSVCANTIRLTPRASPAAIKAELQASGLVFRLLQSPAFQARLPKRFQGFAKRRHTREEIDAAAANLIAAKVASRGYIAAGWFKALAVFRLGSARRVSSKGLAGQGRATRATASRLTATFENFSRGAGEVGSAALQQAMNEEGESMKAFAEKKLAEAWR